jgi:hypothetical protein
VEVDIVVSMEDKTETRRSGQWEARTGLIEVVGSTGVERTGHVREGFPGTWEILLFPRTARYQRAKDDEASWDGQ